MLKPYRLLTRVNQREHPCEERFSRRQTEILRELWKGKQNTTIAYGLSICESTVNVHIRHIMKKLNAHNRTEVVLLTRFQDENGSAAIDE